MHFFFWTMHKMSKTTNMSSTYYELSLKWCCLWGLKQKHWKTILCRPFSGMAVCAHIILSTLSLLDMGKTKFPLCPSDVRWLYSIFSNSVTLVSLGTSSIQQPALGQLELPLPLSSFLLGLFALSSVIVPSHQETLISATSRTWWWSNIMLWRLWRKKQKYNLVNEEAQSEYWSEFTVVCWKVSCSAVSYFLF